MCLFHFFLSSDNIRLGIIWKCTKISILAYLISDNNDTEKQREFENPVISIFFYLANFKVELLPVWLLLKHLLED